MTARTRLGLLGLLLAALLGVGALPAMAHDVLATSDPAEGDVLDAAPADITLVFSGDVKALGTKILVKGPSGEVQDGTPTVDKMVVKQKLTAGAPAGAYTVEWRVTSSDGHPIAGTIHFTVKGGSESAPATSSGGTTSAGTTPAGTTAGSTTAPPPGPGGATTVGGATSAAPSPTTTAPSEPTGDRWGLWAVLGGLALLVAAGLVYVGSRRRH